MASIISSGTTSGTALNFSGDTSGVLQLATNGTTTALSISTAQVVTLTNALPVTSGGTGVTTSTGTGAVVLGTSPTLTTPALGTPSALVLTNATGLPQAGLGTNVAGNGPAFSAYQSTQQASLTAVVSTLMQFQTEEWDTGGCFNNTGSTVTLNGVSAPQYSFAPNVAGYYQISGSAAVASSNTWMFVAVYKNGSLYKRSTNTNPASISSIAGSSLVYLNGTSDYVQLYCQQGANQQLVNTSDVTYFQAAMVRSA